jgi:hypothetical protein
MGRANVMKNTIIFIYYTFTVSLRRAIHFLDFLR